MTIAASQKSDQRPIAFSLLQNGALLSTVTLIIRPEELNREEPSRLTVQQTLGGAYLDSFGPGISTINIAGNTGWRAGFDEDGESHFHRLREDVFLRWHELRRVKAQSGDPDRVEMVLTDTLNRISLVVAPHSFKLQRHKNRPLLFQYSMRLIVLREASTAIRVDPREQLSSDRSAPPTRQVPQSAMDALIATNGRRAGLALAVRAVLDPAARVVADLVDATSSVLTAVVEVTSDGVDAFDAVSAPAIYISRQVELASRNIVQTLIEPLAITERVKRTLREVYSNASEAYCNLTNSFAPIGQYLDFSDLYGASNCSSTTGGRPQTPFADENPFLSLYPSRTNPVVLTLDARTAVTEAAQDVLTLQSRSTESKLDLVRRMSTGISAGMAA